MPRRSPKLRGRSRGSELSQTGAGSPPSLPGAVPPTSTGGTAPVFALAVAHLRLEPDIPMTPSSSRPQLARAALLACVVPLVSTLAGCSSGGGDGGAAVLAGPSRSTNVALTSDDRILVVANRDADTVTLLR